MIAATDDKGTRSGVEAPVPAGDQVDIKPAALILIPVAVALWRGKGWMKHARKRGRKRCVDWIGNGSGSVAIGRVSDRQPSVALIQRTNEPRPAAFGRTWNRPS